MTPAEELSAAAAKVRAIVAPTVPGPYTAVWSKGRIGGTVWRGRVQLATTQERIGTPSPHMADWFALAHPGLAAPLLAILESAAGQAKAMSRADDFGICDEPAAVREALNLARVINGGAS